MGSGRWRRGFIKVESRVSKKLIHLNSHTKISGFSTATKVCLLDFCRGQCNVDKDSMLWVAGIPKEPISGFYFIIIYYILYFVFAFLDQVSLFSLYIYHELWALQTLESWPKCLLSRPPLSLSLSLSLSIGLYRGKTA